MIFSQFQAPPLLSFKLNASFRLKSLKFNFLNSFELHAAESESVG